MRINIVETVQTMGNCSERDAERFAAYLERRLQETWPEAEVRVEVNNRLSGTQVETDGVEAEDVHAFINRIWDRESEWARPAAGLGTTVTADNLESIRPTLPLDQAAELVIGCETWPITYQGGQRGQITVWPNGRAAIEQGGDSSWGDWDEELEAIRLESGETVKADGSVLPE